MTNNIAAHIKWLEDRLANETMDDFTRCQVMAALALAKGC